MTEQHQITPPPELVQQLQAAATIGAITTAYQAGADQELEACCEWADKTGWDGAGDALRSARRPKPSSLKEQALEALQKAAYQADDCPPEGISDDQIDIIRRALEALND